MPTTPPSDLPCLGPRSLAMLAAAGIHGRSDLERLGPVQAYLRVKAAGQNTSLNLLWALEGCADRAGMAGGRQRGADPVAARAGRGATA